MKLADNYADRPGPQDSAESRERDNGGRFSPNVYVYKHLDDKDDSKGGTRKVYLSERIAKEYYHIH
jgi:hypothetical protein